MNKEISKIIEQLSSIELKVVPYLNLSFDEIVKKSGLDSTSVTRALKFLENKELLKLKTESKNIIQLGTNGIYYKKNHLPERKLIITLESVKRPTLDEAKKLSKLSDNEFKASLGTLKKKAMIDLKDGKIILNASKAELSKKSLEEQFIEILPIEESSLSPEQKFAFENLKRRKEIVEKKEKKKISIELTEAGKEIAGKEIKSNLIEEITPQLIKTWSRGKKLRRYDIKSPVPAIHGGKRHFVNQSISYAKKIWTDLGFKEMTGPIVQTSFWNFDALFTAQDHPVREMHDTFFIKGAEGKLPNKELVNKVKQAHETGVGESKGWQYKWDEKDAKKVILRTHTTGLSAKKLSQLKPSDLPAKFFAIGKVFRNETVDWSHGFEFNQTEGIVIDPNANLRNLIGYLKEFAKKMGFKNVRIQPAYFPYTEPSLEGAIWNEEKKEWVEVLAAGIFRPEVTIPLLGTATPVLAWGPGFDRLMLMAYKMKDLRRVYKNDIKELREKGYWTK